MKRFILPVIVGLMLFIQAFFAPRAEAVCATVKIEILQELTLERVAFDAKLVITNSIPDKSLDNVRVDVLIKDGAGYQKNEIFFVRPPALTGISAVDGTGTVAAGARGEAHWLIIPAAGAGVLLNEDGTLKQAGVDYFVGATLTYSIGGVEEVVAISPDKITVKPMPQLVLDYFMPYEVIGDNPFTPQVEPPVPYPLAVRVMNDGYGPAMKLRIDSAQPKIVDNKQGLLIGFRLLGASVNDSPATSSLTVDFGDLASKKAATAYWKMISTLSGHFIEFKTSFTHASELGGDLTSLINETNAHYLTHMIKANLPGRDNRLDFLAEAIVSPNSTHLPDTIYESEIPNGGTDISLAKSPVAIFYPSETVSRPTPEVPTVKVTLHPTTTGWVYTKFDDPSQGLLKLLDVIRGDGIHLDPNNFWVDQGLDPQSKNKTYKLQFVDYRADTNATEYTLVYTQPDVDTTAPVTTIIFNGPVTGDTTKYITTQTQIIYTAEDNPGGSGVEGMYTKVSGRDTAAVPAYPFSFTTPGTYTIEYYSADRAGNVEKVTGTDQYKAITVKVDSAPPAISGFSATPSTIIPQAPKGVAAARNVTFQLTAADDVASLPVTLDIISGAGTPQEKVLRTLTGTAQSGTPFSMTWDARDTAGNLVPTGTYTARAKVSDGLNNPADAADHSHTATSDITITAADWFVGQAIDPNPAPQLYPKVAGTKVVWQDQRSGQWDIYLKDMAAPETASTPLTTKAVDIIIDHIRPSIDTTNDVTTIVWQEQGVSGWDIYGYNLATTTKFPINIETGDQERPVVAGDWVAWQDNRNGNWDIYVYNLTAQKTVRITSHERDQLHPAITGTTLYWEDYRNGVGQIYQYDLSNTDLGSTEPIIPVNEQNVTRRTFDDANHTAPAAAGGTLVWTDDRDGQKDIFRYDPVKQGLRLTYGSGDHSQAAVAGNLLVYTDFEAGVDDPNLSFFDLTSGVGGRLTSDPARQEEPALGPGRVYWQDNRRSDGIYQIYFAPFTVEPLPIEVELKPGFNLIAVGQWLATTYPLATTLLVPLNLDKAAGFDNLHNTHTEVTTAGGDFTLAKGMGIVVYAKQSGTFKLAESGEIASYNLLPGTNQIGVLAVPYGYSAYDLLNSVGVANIQSVRRFDSINGEWQTVAVRGNGMVGMNFTIYPGDGLIITMKNRVDGWTP